MYWCFCYTIVMSLSLGIVGLPNVGKSTLFNALTRKSVDAENYPFCTIDPSVGVVPVPDQRLNDLHEMTGSAREWPAVVEFVDIAGLVKGASTGEGLGNKFLANIRETDAIVHVVRVFENNDVIHVENRIDPVSDIQIINWELIAADKSTVEKRISTNARDVKRGDKTAVAEQAVLDKALATLVNDRLISQYIHDYSEDELDMLKGLHLITAKPMLYVLNKDSGAENLDETDDERWEELMEYMRSQSALYVTLDVKTEHELNEFDFEEKASMRQEIGGQIDDIDLLIARGYELLDLISYFTTGETETRAWTIPRDSTAPRAGRAIHGDFETKFIRADVIASQDLLACGSKAVAREKGLLRTEGKDYIVKDGDVIEFKV